LVETVMVPKLLHPFDGSVTVNVYVPGALTVVVAEAALTTPEDHWKVAPETVELPDTVTTELVQVMVGELAIVISGTPALALTTTVEVLVHPFPRSVTVKV
jgi:hypothetical protein